MKHLSLVPRYSAASAWSQHVPVAHWLIESLQPRTVVELGTYLGTSFFAFCEAAEQYSPETFIHAVDTWQGDEHAGVYGEDVYQKVAAHWACYHKQRSSLIRSTFDEAAGYFSHGSIDLLHCDGLHTYEAVRHDYETWKPHMAEDGVVLFHDINVRTRGFGVWKLWDELNAERPGECLALRNGHGLGMLFLGGRKKPSQEEWEQIMPAMTAKGLILEKMVHEAVKADAAAHEFRMLKAELTRIKQSRRWRICAKLRSIFR